MRSKIIIINIIIAFAFCTLSSCQTLINIALGIKKPRILTHQQQVKYLSKQKVDSSFIYNFNLVKKDSLTTNTFQLDTFSIKSFTPIQFRTYDSTGKFI